MPFDYLTQRRTKMFFKEEIIDITRAMLSKEYALSKFNIDEYEEEQVREVPELSTRLKALMKVSYKPKARKQGRERLRIRGGDSGSDDSANNEDRNRMLQKYNYG